VYEIYVDVCCINSEVMSRCVNTLSVRKEHIFNQSDDIEDKTEVGNIPVSVIIARIAFTYRTKN